MWPVSDRFLTALGSPHRIVSTVSVTPPGGDTVEMAVKSGSVSVDQHARVRRKASLEVFGTAADYNTLTTDGAVITITHGIRFGNDEELVPVFTGELIDGTQQLGDGTISFSCADMWTRVTRCNFPTPYSPTPATSRRTVIAALVEEAVPGTLIRDTASDTGTAGTGVWADSRSDAITDLATAGLMECFFGPDGSFVIRDQPTLTGASVWSITAGTGGTLASASRRRPKERLYNSVIVSPSASDGSQTWAPQTAIVTDTASPRHPSKVGLSTQKYSNPTIPTAAAAMAVAVRRLDLALGSTETLSLGAVSNPALEGGDVIRIITPTINEQPATIFQHFIDSLTISLADGDMSVETRSQAVTDG